ncbi:MAG: hypothetical protein EAZ18_00175 [Oscillatoriales cyanobacterium]|nr:MAG: hypothetical protein EAZ18_00175 [Oscillatoriales cyanobacterium]
MIRSLQTKGIFACLCSVTNSAIFCELVATNGSQEPEISLLDVDTGDRYLVRSPSGKNVLWNYSMEKVDASI